MKSRSTSKMTAKQKRADNAASAPVLSNAKRGSRSALSASGNRDWVLPGVCYAGTNAAGVPSAPDYLCRPGPASQSPMPPRARSFCLPSSLASSSHPRPCPLPTRVRHSASWKVAITNPICDSQRNKTKRWRRQKKGEMILSFNFIHQQERSPSFKIATFNGMGRWVGVPPALQSITPVKFASALSILKIVR